MQRWYDDLKKGDFIAHVYKNEMEQSRILLDLLNWLDEDEKFVYLTDKWPLDGVGPGADARNTVFEAAMEEGRFETTAPYIYRENGKMGRLSVSEIIYSVMEKVKEEGYHGMLLGSEDSWIHSSQDDFDSYIVKEMQLTLTKLPPNVSVLCHYDGRLFSSDQSDRLSSMHPLSLSNGRLYRNYWVVSTKSWDMMTELPKVSMTKATPQTAEKW